jgi:hypothetical protein
MGGRMTYQELFDHKYMGFYKPTLWWRIKMFFVGKKIEQVSDGILTVWYTHNGKIYLTEYKSLGQK